METKKLTFRLLLIGLAFITINCSGQPDTYDIPVPEVHNPDQILDLEKLQNYTIAYCWSPPDKETTGERHTDIIISRGDGSQLNTISIPPPPPNKIVILGCPNERDGQIQIGKHSLAWRPDSDQLLMTNGPLKNFANFYLVDLKSDLTPEMPGQTITAYKELLEYPRGISWSPDGEWVATVGGDTQSRFHYLNIWIYKIDTNEAIRITDFDELEQYVMNASWSPDGLSLAVGYGFPPSGIGIAHFDTLDNPSSFTYIDISSDTQPSLFPWPFYADSLWEFTKSLIFPNSGNIEYYINQNSHPVWVNEGGKIIFTAPTDNKRVTLFIVNADGTDLQEFLPELPGMNGLPTISSDGQKLAFVRYPKHTNTGRAEIAVVDLTSMEISSLVVLPEPSDNQIFISGLDWTPDGKYLAFSSNHEGASNIYVISTEGDAWINLTADRDGDSVYPVWKP